MSDFKESIKSVELSALPDIARQLLQRLDGGSEAQAQARKFTEPGAEGAGWADFEFAQAEPTAVERSFLDGAERGFELRQFSGERIKTVAERFFGEDENTSGMESFRFLGAALPGERAKPGTAEAAIQGGYAMEGRGHHDNYDADPYRDMEEISEFFRRDGRRYDGGFKQY